MRVRLTAPPVDDRANQSLRRFLADRLNVAISAVTIVSGEKSRTKTVAVVGVTATQVTALVRTTESEASRSAAKKTGVALVEKK